MTANTMTSAKVLLRAQLACVALIVGVLLLFGGIRGATDLAHHRDTEDKIELSQKQQHFWRQVDGSDSVTGSVGSRFARDIRSLDGASLNSFRGNSNTYGGVVDEIGYNPFDSSGLNCFECGPLNALTRANLEAVHRGQVSTVLDSLRVTDTASYHFTPFNWSFVGTATAVWAFGGPLALLGAHLYLTRVVNRRCPEGQHPLYTGLKSVNWSERDALILVWTAPTFFAPHRIWLRQNEKRAEQRVRSAFPEHMEVLDSVDRALEHLGPHEAATIRDLRDEVRKELTVQSKSDDNQDTQYADQLVKELKDVQEYLAARVEARKELSQ